MSESTEPSPAQPSEQYVKMEWDTPTHEQIIQISRSHVAGMEASDDDNLWQMVGMHHVIVHTRGRRSGNEHKVALPIWRDDDGERIVIASYAGHTNHPSWFVNLSDRSANPEVFVRTQQGAYWSTHEILDGEDYARVWSGLTADREWYLDYQARTERRIPLVRLPETRPAE